MKLPSKSPLSGSNRPILNATGSTDNPSRDLEDTELVVGETEER
jgi:hypothetical protein